MMRKTIRCSIVITMLALATVALYATGRIHAVAEADADGDFDVTPAQAVDLAPALYVPAVVLDKAATDTNIPPIAPYAPDPENGATGVIAGTTYLSWHSGDPDNHAVTYDVYLEAYDPTPDTLLVQNLTASQISFQSWGLTTYYWQVVARDSRGGVSYGPVWHFTTGACPVYAYTQVPQADGLQVNIAGGASSQCSNITSPMWDWGDGTSDSQDFPASHTYANPGGYTVTLWIYNDQGMFVSKTISLYVGPVAGVCNYVTEIPASECDALVALYESAGGPNWIVQPGWIVLTTPCQSWQGVQCADGHVTVLELSDVNLVGDMPPEIGNLSALEVLYISIDGATSIPAEIGNLDNVRQVHLEGSDITQLPPEIGDMALVNDLYLFCPSLTHLPSEIGDLTTLTALGLSVAQVKVLPREIGNLTGLTRFSFGPSSVITLPVEIGNLNKLELFGVDGDLTNVPDAIGNLDALVYLYLNSNALSTLPSTMGDLAQLRYLEVANNQLTNLPTTIGDLQLYGLKLSNNPGLTGPVPEFLTSQVDMHTFRFDGTGWCEPVSGPVRDWLDALPFYAGTGIACEEANVIQMCLVDGG